MELERAASFSSCEGRRIHGGPDGWDPDAFTSDEQIADFFRESPWKVVGTKYVGKGAAFQMDYVLPLPVPGSIQDATRPPSAAETLASSAG